MNFYLSHSAIFSTTKWPMSMIEVFSEAPTKNIELCFVLSLKGRPVLQNMYMQINIQKPSTCWDGWMIMNCELCNTCKLHLNAVQWEPSFASMSGCIIKKQVERNSDNIHGQLIHFIQVEVDVISPLTSMCRMGNDISFSWCPNINMKQYVKFEKQ